MRTVRLLSKGRPPASSDSEPPAPSPWTVCYGSLGFDPSAVAKWSVRLFVAVVIAFSVAPIVNHLRGLPNKDYNLWYATGKLVREGRLIYPLDNRPFPFMYPPACASMLAITGSLGELPFVLLCQLANSASWAACIFLSIYLATGKFLGQHPLLYAGPTLVVIPFVHDMYLLGQPALGLLACLLGAFACLRVGRPWVAGSLVALAAAVKAYPILALGLFIYRRQWKATAGTLLALAFLMLVLPLPLRGARQTWADLARWTGGMVLKYDKDTIAQRPERSYSFKNQSLIALANRLLRDVPANGEAKDGWKVSIAHLDFRATNAAIVGTALGLCLFYLATMPRFRNRNDRSDSLEAAMLLLLIQAFNPLSFDYSFVWLLYPLTLTVALILEAPAGSRVRALLIGGLVSAILVFSLALPFRRVAQAYGNLLIADLLLFVLLGWQLSCTQPTTPQPALAAASDDS